MKRPLILIAGAALTAAIQIGLLLWVIQGRAAVLRDGPEILLKVEPVDPRDLLRGDYVRLGYAMSLLPKTLFGSQLPVDAVEDGRAVYVVVEPGPEGAWQATAAGWEHPGQIASGARVVRGKLESGWFDGDTAFRVAYGIERFYLPEGEGLAIERDMRTRSFFVKVALGADGTPQIKSFLDGETELYREPYY